MSDRQAVINQLLNRDRLSAEHTVFIKQEASAAVASAQGALIGAELARDSTPDEQTEAAVTTAREALEAAWRAAEEHVVTLRFEGLAPDVFDELKGEHMPTAEQEEKAGAPLEWNPKTFPSALIAATCTDPGFASDGEAHEVFYGPKARFSKEEASDVFRAALATCQGKREVADWGKGSGETAG